MDDRQNDAKETGADPGIKKRGLTLPLIALGLDLLPVLLLFLYFLGIYFSFIFYSSWFFRGSGLFMQGIILVTILSPIAGLITGIVALHEGKAYMSKLEKTLAIIAVTLPLALIAFIIILYVGVRTGLVPFM